MVAVVVDAKDTADTDTTDTSDTIVAQATPAGKGGIGIVRLSGKASCAIARQICRPYRVPSKINKATESNAGETSFTISQLPELNIMPRLAQYVYFFQSEQVVLDTGLLLFFPAPNSFTGEDVIEFQAHGSPVVMDALLARATELGARLARPGEFSERAFLNGKLDLTQAEAIADLIDSRTQAAARAAVRSLQGAFSNRVNNLTSALIRLRTHVEATIDFPDEDIDFTQIPEIKVQLTMLLQQIQELLQETESGIVLQQGLNVVIAGPPNAGKSSLLNLLSGSERAIVTPLPGTTRDVLQVSIQLDGLPIELIDTAGIRNLDSEVDVVEQEGMRRAQSHLQQADLILLMLDAEVVVDTKLPQTRAQLAALLEFELPETIPVILLLNKIDLLVETTTKLQPSVMSQAWGKVVYLSVKEQQGIALLSEQIKQRAGQNDVSAATFSARRRHYIALQDSLRWLQRSEQQLDAQGAAELFAEDLRLAQQCLATITGEFTADDLLGEIFSSFCIGK